jgi:hypothetical protein
MNNTGKKASDEIEQLLKLVKTNKGLNSVQSISYLAGMFYTFLTEEEISVCFEIAEKKL